MHASGIERLSNENNVAGADVHEAEEGASIMIQDGRRHSAEQRWNLNTW